ncbi:MAG: hypothetical protein SVX43_01650 [Cyanobacteriota bacterium]|nr:hypothetical protein [Cyanobacteriota bacterium]
MKKYLIPLFLASVLLATGSTNWVAAQSPNPEEQTVEPIALPSDGPEKRPVLISGAAAMVR